MDQNSVASNRAQQARLIPPEGSGCIVAGWASHGRKIFRRGGEAAAEFQKIRNARGQAPLSVLYPLSNLGLARAWSMKGEAAKGRQAYEDFFAAWKEADTDLPILAAAKREYEKR